MTNRPLLTVLLATQIVFALACTGGASSNGNTAGSDVRLDDTQPPTAERPDLQDDDRCDWLGAPFASTHDDRVYVLRMTDPRHDCADGAQAEQKLLFAVDDTTAEPVLDLTELDDLRLLGTDAGLLLLSEKADQSEHAWLVDGADGTVLQEADLTPFTVSTTSPSGRWVAVGNDGWMPNDGMELRLLDPSDLTLTTLVSGPEQGAFAWLPGDRLVTATYDAEGLALALYDLGEGIPSAPLFTTRVEGLERPWYPEQPLAVAPDGTRVAVPVMGEGDERALLWDTSDASTVLTERISGTLAFTDTDLLIGGGPTVTRWDVSGELRTIQPDGTGASFAFDETPAFVSAPHGSHLLVSGDEATLSLFDLRTQRMEALDLGSTIDAFTLRQTTVWLTDGDGLRYVDLATGDHGTHDGPSSRHVLYVPTRDALYVGDTFSPTVRFVDPDSGSDLAAIDLIQLTGTPTPLSNP